MLTAAVMAALVAAPAAAISPVNHEEPIITGDVGVHILIDSGEPYNAVTCRYQANQLIGFRVRRPITLPDGADQSIGWRFSIEGTDDPDPTNATWQPRYTSDLVKRLASDKQPPLFRTITKDLGNLTRTWYRVVVRLFWYRPTAHQDGKALIAAESYQNGDGSITWADACPSNELTTSTAVSEPPDPETKDVDGTYGINMLIDETDDWSFSGAMCSYQSGALRTVTVRRPIAFAAGSKQTIRWRWVIEGTNDTLDPWVAAWAFVKQGPLHTAVAKPPQPAAFLPDIATLPSTLAFALYRVVVKVFWYRPSQALVGHSFMAVESYDDGIHTDEEESFFLGCPASHP